MFPIPWNFPFRKKNGNLVNIGDAIDDGTELPEHDAGDAGKVLSVDENGDLEWSDDVNTEIQTLTNNVKARAELGAYNLLNIANSEINTSGTYTEVINDDGTVTIGGTPTSACTIPYRATTNYNGNVYNLKPSTDYVLDSGLSAISPLNLQVFVKENSGSSWSKIAETTTDTKLQFTTPASFYDLWARILIPANANVPANTILKPQILLASDVNIAFAPYAMTNRELTQNVTVLKYDDEWLHLRKQGHLVNLVFDNAQFELDGKTFTKTIPSEFIPEQQFVYVFGTCYNGSAYVDTKLVIKNTGDIILADNYGTAIQGIEPLNFSGRNTLYYGI